ncbi:hypothetical protein Poli38472_005180 [Pythium oligandrum]|uniref:lipid-A-disaccharide synthase n=1 Tax=Pythium oligandrum TaxID=41045 RepID=A0A8K1CI61_PYTOL|nr:hypothetical protein Poli38472_005180 [Pythium oligandrum]|eukprot:TMW62562.1 hypothetical protein Poli38472_005180 [Pythium oligandrum]
MLGRRVARPRVFLRGHGVRGVNGAATREKRVYLIAGEASGDAIGSQVISALQRLAANDPSTRFVFGGIGGQNMCKTGGFESLFPMQELSVMGLVEVLPYVFRFKRRLSDTVSDIKRFRPDLVLTIDSKGFTFRVLRALMDDPTTRDSILRMHCVAPSVWAYKHRQRKTNYDDLATLLHKMFVILPFEEAIFNGAKGGSWCEFVGHPAVEAFLEYHGAFDEKNPQQMGTDGSDGLVVEAGGLLDLSKYGSDILARQGAVLRQLMTKKRDVNSRKKLRERLNLPHDAFVICGLVGSRQNEVHKTLSTVLAAVKHLQESSPSQKITLVLPTISAVRSLIEQKVAALPFSFSDSVHILVDCNTSTRFDLFNAADAAVAVSGTIVMETALNSLPTVVIYRANRLTEFLAKQLSAVNFVSIPNLLLGRSVIPELLFQDCKPDAISNALRAILHTTSNGTHTESSVHQDPGLPAALSTLAKWTADSAPIRGSDCVAHSVWKMLDSQSVRHDSAKNS